jgi:hypothetical protein
MKTQTFAVMVVLLASGCGGKPKNPVVTQCAEQGQRCRMGGNKLGVCMQEPSGKYFCADQH